MENTHVIDMDKMQPVVINIKTIRSGKRKIREFFTYKLAQIINWIGVIEVVEED